MRHSDLRGARRGSAGVLLLLVMTAASLWKLAADHDYMGKGDFLAY